MKTSTVSELHRIACLASEDFEAHTQGQLMTAVKRIKADLERIAIGHDVRVGDIWRLVGFECGDETIWKILSDEGRFTEVRLDRDPGSEMNA